MQPRLTILMDAFSTSRGSGATSTGTGELESREVTAKRPPATTDPAQKIAHGRLFAFGRFCFCAGLAGFAVLQLIYADVIPGRAPPWPAELPGRQPIAYLMGSAILLVAFALWRRRGVIPATGLMIVGIIGWALARQVPLVLTDVALGGTWTHAGKALVLIGGFSVFGSWPARLRVPPATGILIARITLGGFMILAGLQHFRWEEFVVTLVPAWAPGGDVFWSRASALLLLAGGMGLLLPRFSRTAARLSGLMIFLWFLTLHLPRAFDYQNQNEWTAVFEALAFSGIGFALADHNLTSPRTA